MKYLFSGEDNRKCTYDFVDVRDVAVAHVLAVKHKQKLDRRFVLSCGEFWWREIA